MAQRGGFRAASATVVLVLVMVCLATTPAFSAPGRRTNHRSLAGGVVAGDPVPPTPAPRLIIEPEKEPEPGPPLWVGAVVGISGLAGLVFSSVGLSRRRDR